MASDELIGHVDGRLTERTTVANYFVMKPNKTGVIMTMMLCGVLSLCNTHIFRFFTVGCLFVCNSYHFYFLL